MTLLDPSTSILLFIRSRRHLFPFLFSPVNTHSWVGNRSTWPTYFPDQRTLTVVRHALHTTALRSCELWSACGTCSSTEARRNLHRFRLSRTQIEAMSLVFSLRAARWNRTVTAIREWIILVLIVGRTNSATLRLYYIRLFPQLSRCFYKPLKNY